MNKKAYWYIVLFLVVVLIQVAFMNNMQFSRFVNPYFYVLFILLLPINIPRYLLLILGFILGITIDIFSNTPGIHASASVFMAFVRPYVVNTSNLDDNEKGLIPSVVNMGFGWFVRYASILIVLHHFFLFYVEIFSFQGFFQTFFRSFFSSIFTFVFIIISQFLVFRK
ncbi:MAG: rod shape-determining protein MreD [Prolixibacteraceae bacterium]|jgi:rod shape-determining protein MreD|nr:rod shape-determining protein MreD [Prolixibacteraceae bacterium]